MTTSTSAYMDTATRDANDTLPQQQGPNLHVIVTIERYLRIIVPVTCGLIFVIGGIGNLLVILAVSLFKQMKTRTNVFILSLAVADLLSVVVILPTDAINIAINDGWLFGPAWCKIDDYITLVTFYASVYTLLGVSFNRFLAVLFPIASMTFRTRSNAIKTVLVIWVIILLANIPILYINDVTKGETGTFCDIADTNSEKVVYGVWFVFGVALPLALMCILYGLIAIRLWRRSVPESSSHGGSSRVKTRAIRMCVVVVTVFAFCGIPFHVWNMWRLFGKRHDFEDIIAFYTVGYVSIVLVYINLCVNPILYAFLSDEFRSSFRKLMRCKSIRKCVECMHCKTIPASPQVNTRNTFTDQASSDRTVSQLNSTADSTVSE